MYSFFNFPKAIPYTKYEHQKNEFLCDLKNLLGSQTFSVYQIGEVWLLWVSDLDFLIVLENFNYKKKIISLAKKFSLVDKPLFITYDNILDIQYFTHHMGFDYVSGKDCILPNLEKNQNIRLIYAWKILFFSALRHYYIPKYSKKINVKALLSHIYDLRYPIHYLGLMFPLESRCLNFISNFEKFRNTWFIHKDQERLLDYLSEAIDITYYLIYIFDKIVWHLSLQKSYFYWRYPTICMNFKDKKDYKYYTERYFNLFGSRDRFVVLPKSLDYRFWKWDLAIALEKIMSINSNFLNFGLDKWWLNRILLIKKSIDFFKIKFFSWYEKI